MKAFAIKTKVDTYYTAGCDVPRIKEALSGLKSMYTSNDIVCMLQDALPEEWVDEHPDLIGWGHAVLRCECTGMPAGYYYGNVPAFHFSLLLEGNNDYLRIDFWVNAQADGTIDWSTLEGFSSRKYTCTDNT